MESFPLNGLMPGHHLVNRGVAGEKTIDIYYRINDIVEQRPKAIFLMAGINDIRAGIPLNTSLNNYRKIIAHTGGISLFILAILPVTFAESHFNDKVVEFNDSLKNICLE
jgi:lysophospholipase L1-like esterase